MDLPNAAPRRVSIVGSTGTGKTTFGRELAAILAVPFVELDALFWGPNWSKAKHRSGNRVITSSIRSSFAS